MKNLFFYTSFKNKIIKEITIFFFHIFLPFIPLATIAFLEIIFIYKERKNFLLQDQLVRCEKYYSGRGAIQP